MMFSERYTGCSTLETEIINASLKLFLFTKHGLANTKIQAVIKTTKITTKITTTTRKTKIR